MGERGTKVHSVREIERGGERDIKRYIEREREIQSYIVCEREGESERGREREREMH